MCQKEEYELDENGKVHVTWEEVTSIALGEIISIVSHVLNKCPTKRLHELTLEGAWTSVKPSVSHLGTFGSLCWKRVPDQLRQKLDDKGVPQMLVGYHSMGGYRIFDPETNQVSISRDMVIDERAEWNCSSLRLLKHNLR